jgi:hypothetical protein
MKPPLRLSFAVDPDAPPSDWDAVLAKFLLSYMRRSAGPPVAEDAAKGTPEEAKDKSHGKSDKVMGGGVGCEKIESHDLRQCDSL